MANEVEVDNPRWAKANRTEVVALRLDPERRLLLELASRKARLSAAKYVEAALDAILETETWHTGGKKERLTTLVSEIWSAIPSLCFVQRAQAFESLLTYEEQVLWALIQQSGLANHPKDWAELEKRWDKLKLQAATRAKKERLFMVAGIPIEEKA